MKKRSLVALAFTAIIAAVAVAALAPHFLPQNASVLTASPSARRITGGHGLVPGTPMHEARASQTATRLQNGKVLIVGGMKADGQYLTSAELYDPATDAFVETGHTSVTRTSHIATLLPNGKVLVAGGSYGQTQQTAEVYDPATGRFNAVAGMSPDRRDGFTATLLATGEVLIAGGYSVRGGYGARGDILASAELYDPATNTFRLAGRMITPRANHTATLLADGRVLLAGGFTPQGVTATAELYDPATGTFAPTGEMADKRHKHAAVRISDGRVLIAGGSDERDFEGRYASMELYDPTTGEFATTTSMDSARYKIGDAVTLLPDGEVLIAGDGEQAALYQPDSRTVRLADGRMDAARFFATATLLPDGRVLIAGGYDGRVRVSERTWLFFP